MSVLGKQFDKAIKQGQDKLDKSTETLVKQNAEIIDKMNWIMESQQAICNKLQIKLKDPLED